MKDTTKTALRIVGVIVLLTGAFAAGAWAVRASLAAVPTAAPIAQATPSAPATGGDMMEGGSAGADRMNNGYGANGMEPGNGYGMMDEGYGAGMMDGGYGAGMMGGNVGPGMMGGYAVNPNAEPLTLDEARQAVEAYLAAWNNPDLAVAEVMVFDNQAYAEIVEKSTGIGAMEVLVDPLTRTVYPEHGPNMMWNLKYSPMGSGYGMMGMMMGYRGGMMGYAPTPDVPTEMPVSPEEARQIAQQFLDTYFPGLQVAEEADPFYGYYTIHTVKDGQVVGMLSVNGYSRQVFPHTWHGQFITMSGEEG